MGDTVLNAVFSGSPDTEASVVINTPGDDKGQIILNDFHETFKNYMQIFDDTGARLDVTAVMYTSETINIHFCGTSSNEQARDQKPRRAGFLQTKPQDQNQSLTQSSACVARYGTIGSSDECCSNLGVVNA